MSVVFDFNASLNDVAPGSLILLAVDAMGKKRKKSELLVYAFVSLLPSPLRLS